MKYRVIALTLMLLISLSLAAQIQDNAGEYGFKFLNVPVSPASIALAGRGMDSYSNPAAFMNQPAISTLNNQRSLGLSHSAWLGDTDFTNLFYSYSNRRKHFGLMVRNLNYGEIDKRDDQGNIIGVYNPLDFNLMANYSLRLGTSSYLGINAGVLYEKLSTASALGFSTDIGFTVLPPLQDAVVSLAVRNLGVSGAMNKQSVKLAPQAELDISKGFTYNATTVNLAVSATKSIDEDFKGTFSTEFGFYDMLYLRAGYKLNYGVGDISAGLGLRYNRFGVDYGWAASDHNLADVHSVGVTYYF